MLKKKEWKIKSDGKEDFSEIKKISEKLGIKPLTARLLYNRGYTTAETAESFIKNDNISFHDSFLLADMDKAVERILSAVEANEKIVIYGDYDVDGVTSVSILYLYLKEKGADVSYYIPSRTGEGYGINPSAIESLAQKETKLLITVDTGITAVDETEYAKSLGLDVLITDHHECQNELPKACAIVNPRRHDCQYPFKELAGVGVVFKLLCSLEYTYCKKNGIEEDWLKKICDTYGDIVAIGTVADVMPLVDENRLIVSRGLKLIETTNRPGIEALLELSGAVSNSRNGMQKKRRITSTLISYVIAPRINAAGRISDATRAVELFLSETQNEARVIAEELCDTNRMRQAEENKIMEQAYEKIRNEHDFENDKVIVLAEDNWHNGAIGIVASRITEKYNLPSVLISFDGNVSKGSGRSIKGLNLVDALGYCSDLLIKYGGHELAAGLSIERDNLPAFKKKINEYAALHLKPENMVTQIDIDAEIDENDVALENAEELFLLEPFGISNPVPVFTMRDVYISEAIAIGSNRHTKLLLKKGNKSITALYFSKNPAELNLFAGDTADLVFNLDVNEYMNNKSVQLTLRDVMPGEKTRLLREKKRSDYAEIKAGREISPEENIVPSRDDFVNVYYAIQRELRQGNDNISVYMLERLLNNMSYEKIRFIVDILKETKVFLIEEKDGVEDEYVFKMSLLKTKINLEKSSILKWLKSQVVKN